MAATLKSKPAAPRRCCSAQRSRALATTAAEAHFQLLYTPEAALNESAAIELALVFSHPFDNGYTMDMGTPEAFYVVSQRGEGGAQDDGPDAVPRAHRVVRRRDEGRRVPRSPAAHRHALARRLHVRAASCAVLRGAGGQVHPADHEDRRERRRHSGRVGRSRSGCRSRSCRSTSRTRIGSAACSAPSCSRTASRCRTPRSRSSS